MKKRLFGVAAATAMSVGLLGIWGCGSDSEEETITPTDTDTNTTVVVTPALIGSWSLSTVEKAGVVTTSTIPVEIVLAEDGALTWTVAGQSKTGTFNYNAGTINLVFPDNPEMNQSHPYWLSGNNLFIQMEVDNRYMFTKE